MRKNPGPLAARIASSALRGSAVSGSRSVPVTMPSTQLQIEKGTGFS